MQNISERCNILRLFLLFSSSSVQDVYCCITVLLAARVLSVLSLCCLSLSACLSVVSFSYFGSLSQITIYLYYYYIIFLLYYLSHNTDFRVVLRREEWVVAVASVVVFLVVRSFCECRTRYEALTMNVQLDAEVLQRFIFLNVNGQNPLRIPTMPLQRFTKNR